MLNAKVLLLQALALSVVAFAMFQHAQITGGDSWFLGFSAIAAAVGLADLAILYRQRRRT